MLKLLSLIPIARKYVFLLVPAGLLLLLGTQTVRLDRASTALAIETSAHQATKAALDAQAAGVAAIEVKAQQLNAAADRAAKAVQRVSAAAEQRARALETAPTPETCQAAIEFLVREAAQ